MPNTDVSARATARACANIAIVKYWGKRNSAIHQPCTGSLGLTLEPLAAVTEVTLSAAPQAQLTGTLDGVAFDPATRASVTRVVEVFLDRGGPHAVHVRSHNTFPTAAGLASSAAGFAALAKACDAAFATGSTERELSAIARLGSGSASRSVCGGWVEMLPEPRGGEAHTVFSVDHWPLSVVVALVPNASKAVSSRVGMQVTQSTSPYFDAWVSGVAGDLVEAKDALRARDLERLAGVAERSALRMHASMIASDPGLLYWSGATVELIHAVRRWRAEGLPVFFTIDAGPHVKVFCEAASAEAVAARLRAAHDGIETRVCVPGPGACIVPDASAQGVL